MKKTVLVVLLVMVATSLVSADDKAIQPAATHDYSRALKVIDNVIANVVLVRTPKGEERGLTRAEVDELRRYTLLLQAAVAELETLKNSPAPEPVAEEAPK